MNVRDLKYRVDPEDPDGWPLERGWFRLWTATRGFLAKKRHVPWASKSAWWNITLVPGDFWRGVFVKRIWVGSDRIRDMEIYICLIPMWPIHIHFRESRDSYDGTWRGLWGITRRIGRAWKELVRNGTRPE